MSKLFAILHFVFPVQPAINSLFLREKGHVRLVTNTLKQPVVQE